MSMRIKLRPSSQSPYKLMRVRRQPEGDPREERAASAEEAHNLALGLAGPTVMVECNHSDEGPTITNDGSNSLAAGDGSMMETDRDMAF